MAEIAKKKRRNSGEQGTKNLLLDTAASIMSERGNINVTLSELGERSGLNTALVRYYFGNKSGMMFALIKRTLANAFEQMNKLLEMDIPADEKLALHIRGVINTYFYHPYVNRLLHHLGTIEDGKYSEQISNQFTRPILNCQTQILKSGQESGLFRDIDPKLLYFHIDGACDQLFHNMAALKELHGIETITQEIKDSYIKHVSGVIIQGIRQLD